MLRFLSKKVIYLMILTLFGALFGNMNLVSGDIRHYSDETDNIELSEIDLSELPEIKYDELNEQWNDTKIEMLIITPDNQGFIDAVTPLMEWKNYKGVKTIILSNFSKYEGTDNAEKIRNMIKIFHARENIQWVLLAGDAQDDLIPIRQVYNPDVIEVGQGNSEHSDWDDKYKPTDFYYSDLTGTWDDNENGIWGESAAYTGTIDEIDWTPDVYVGRFPASTANELKLMVEKTLKYEKNPYIGDWMNQMLLAGGISETNPPEDEARLTEYIWKYYTSLEMNFTHQYRSTSSFKPTEPSPPNQLMALTRDNFRAHFDSGYSTVIFAGHGEPTRFTDAGSTSYISADASASGNTNMPSLVYSDACTTSPYDKTDDSIGELLIKRADAGAIGFIGGLRVTWYFQYDAELEMLNRANAKLFWKAFFKEGIYQQGKALYDSKVSYMLSDYFINNASIEHEWERKNMLTYSLLGDPEVDIYTQKPVAISNPFPTEIYEGQTISATIKDVLGRIVPNARVNFKSNSSESLTIYSDINGEINFRLPIKKLKFDVIVTGHNIIPSYFSFTPLSDVKAPQFVGSLSRDPEVPTVSDNICFNITSQDNHSGVEGVYLLVSENDFKDFTYQELENKSQGTLKAYSCDLKKLDPGEYSFIVIARDYAGNVVILEDKKYRLSLAAPISMYFLIGATIISVGMIGMSFYFVLKERKKYARTYSRQEADLLKK